MLARGERLTTFGEFKKKASEDIYLPGEVYPQGSPLPKVSEEYGARPLVVLWDYPFQLPDSGLGGLGQVRRGRPVNSVPRKRVVKRVVPVGITPFSGSGFVRFSGGKSLREFGKEKILKDLAFLPSDRIQNTVPFSGFRRIPQRPQYFPELAGFGQDEIPVGTANATGGGPVETGIWGNLVSLLTTAGAVMLQTETQQTQREISASQASIAASQAQTTQSKVLASLYNNLPLLIALVGGGTLLYIYMPRKKARAKR